MVGGGALNGVCGFTCILGGDSGSGAFGRADTLFEEVISLVLPLHPVLDRTLPHNLLLAPASLLAFAFLLRQGMMVGGDEFVLGGVGCFQGRADVVAIVTHLVLEHLANREIPLRRVTRLSHLAWRLIHLI